MAKSPFFQFKQFKVWHDQCGLKVTTEACILGALTPILNAKRVLDVGTGTGLLALMMAQRNNEAMIDAIEIDEKAYQQAQQNIADSPFAKQIRVQHTSLQNFANATSPAYDLIVSNPPFYENHLRSPNVQKNNALHADTLPFQELALGVERLLSPEGRFVVLLPPYSTQRFVKIAQDFALYLTAQIAVYQLSDKPIFRNISVFELNPKASITTTNFTIYDEPQRYSAQFGNELQKFYIKL